MSADALPDLDDLLARLKKADPALAERQLQFEVDDLLGRETKTRKAGSSKRGSSDTDEGAEARRSWLGSILRRTPPHVDHDHAVELARSVEAGVYAGYKLSSVKREHMTRGYTKILRKVRDEGTSSFEYLVLCNLRLVYFWCRRLAGSMDEDWIQDAFQVGCIGLIRGLQGWDYTRGALSTYVSWHIRQQIQRWRMNEVDIIRVPVHVWEGISSGSGGLSDEVVRSAQNAFGIRYLSGSTDLELEGEHLFSDPAYVDDGGIEAFLHRTSLGQVATKVAPLLSERELSVVLSRSGVNSVEPATLQQIGDQFGVTRERIRQIERDAMKKLRADASLREAWEAVLT